MYIEFFYVHAYIIHVKLYEMSSILYYEMTIFIGIGSRNMLPYIFVFVGNDNTTDNKT